PWSPRRHPRESLRPHQSPGRHPCPADRGADQRRNRRPAAHLAKDGGPPRLGRAGQAGGRHPRGSRRFGPPPPGFLALRASRQDRLAQPVLSHAILPSIRLPNIGSAPPQIREPLPMCHGVASLMLCLSPGTTRPAPPLKIVIGQLQESPFLREINTTVVRPDRRAVRPLQEVIDGR